MGKTRIGYRSAITGRFVKPGDAKKHPRTTVGERIPVKPKKGE
ncbi:MAG: hypothetical protein Q8Q12_20535 [bacterium]|nr:hypothetical protein [bacterium]